MSTILSREEALFAAAIAQPMAHRAAYLEQVCGDDAALLERLATLIAAHEKTESLLGSAAALRPPEFDQESTGELIGRYKLLQKIGEGGCGVVWLAEQEEPVRRRVALKVIKLGMDTKAVIARFEAERQALALMDHPNIAKVFDGGATESGRPFFVMELVRGITITNYCDDNHLTPTERLELFMQVCHAVQHAHQKGIIHRDLKPSNILVTLSDGAPTPKIIDFGIAKATQGRLTDATLFTTFEQLIGTPVYMSPEQAEMSSLDIDTRSDIYSLGVLLYELLAGRPPFDPKAFARAGVEEIRHHIRDDELPKPSTRWRTLAEAERTTLARQRSIAPGQLSLILRGDLDWIVMRCVEKDRTRRYDTADAIAADIGRHLRHEPIAARPPGTAYLLQKWIRRHRVAFSAAAAVAGMLVLGIAFSTWQALRATRAERDALEAQHNEARLRQRAEEQELIARQRAYAADMYLAQQMLAGDNHTRAREVLKQQVPRPDQRDLRGWEWRHLWHESALPGVGVLLDTHRGVIWSMSASSDGGWLALGSFWWQAEVGGNVTLWDLRRRQKFERRIGDASTRVKFSPRAPLLAMSGFSRVDRTRSWIELWNVETDQMERRLELGEPCAAIVFSDDGSILVTATFTTAEHAKNRWITITHWRVRDGSKLRPPYRAPETTSGSSVEYPFVTSSDLQLAAYPTQNRNEFRVIELDTGRERWSARLDGAPSALAFSPDARLILASGGNRVIQSWDVTSGNEVGPPLEGHRASVESLVFWPDGKTLASGSRDRSIRLWDVSKRQQLHLLIGHESEVFELELLPGQDQFVSGDRNGSIRLWRPWAPRERPVSSIVVENVSGWQFAANSRSIIVSHRNLSLAELTIPGFAVKRKIEIDLPATLRDHLDRERVFDDWALFARDRPLLAIGSRDGIVWVFDFERRVQLAEIKISSGRVVPHVFLARDNRLIIWDAERSPTIYHEWDLTLGVETATWPGPERFGWFTTTADEKYALMLETDGLGQVRDMTTGARRDIRLPIEAVSGAGFSADGRLLGVASRIGYAKVWQFPQETEVARLSGVLTGIVSIAFHPGAPRIATGCSAPHVLRLWDVESLLPVLSFDGAAGGFSETAFSPDGRTLASLSPSSALLRLWFAPSWAEIAAMEQAAAHSGQSSGWSITR